MSVEIRVIPKDKKSLKKFVQFGTDMYKGNDCFVPPLRMDDVNTLSPDVNPAFELCDAEYFMAFRDACGTHRCNHPSPLKRAARQEGDAFRICGVYR